MEHKVIAQAAPYIAGIETLGTIMAKGILGKAEYPHFDVLIYLNLGRYIVSGLHMGNVGLGIRISVVGFE